jgi:hypothetical protein
MMKKDELLELIKSFRGRVDITIKLEDTGIAWLGFWLGLGIVIAAQVIVTGKEFLK